MKALLWTWLAVLTLLPLAYAEEPDEGADDEATTETVEDEAADESGGSKDPGGPKTLSGMSILGNEEAPKSLVIIPWKSSEIGSDLGLNDGLDERAEPVDRDVFLRELEFYEIRSGN